VRFSVRSRIFLSFVLVQLVTAVVVVGWYFYTVSGELRGLNRVDVEEAVLETIAATKEYFGPPEAAARITGDLLAAGVLDRAQPERLERYFLEQLRQMPALAGLYIGYPDGAFYYVLRSDEGAPGGTLTKEVLAEPAGRTVRLTWRDAELKVLRSETDPADDYDPRTRPWYQAAEAATSLIWTSPYVFFTAHKPGITAALPVIGADGRLAAVVGLDIELSAISRFLVQVGFRSSGSAFILSDSGDVIAHGNDKLVFADQPQADAQPRFRKAEELPGIDGAVGRLVMAETAAVGSGALNVAEHEIDGEDYFVAAETLGDEGRPWRVVALVRAAGIVKTLQSGSLLLLAVVLFTTGFACLAGWVISGSIGRPLAELRRDAAHAQQGNFELMSDEPSGIAEIDETHEALKALAERQRGLRH
jgi:hypothetical protein